MEDHNRVVKIKLNTRSPDEVPTAFLKTVSQVFSSDDVVIEFGEFSSGTSSVNTTNIQIETIGEIKIGVSENKELLDTNAIAESIGWQIENLASESTDIDPSKISKLNKVVASKLIKLLSEDPFRSIIADLVSSIKELFPKINSSTHDVSKISLRDDDPDLTKIGVVRLTKNMAYEDIVASSKSENIFVIASKDLGRANKSNNDPYE